MQIFTANPLLDARWDDLVARHSRASAFHQRGWLEALARTYSYEPLFLTSTPPDKPLESAIVLCRISSLITGRRLVSLPFADHCEPLLNDPEEFQEFGGWLQTACEREGSKYVEIRPVSNWEMGGLAPNSSYHFHELDLAPPIEQLFAQLHKDSVQRRIQRAEREQLEFEVGRSSALVDAFYHLTTMTRRRHGLFPQPRAWFKNLVECMGDSVDVRLARKDGMPIAALLTLRHQKTVVYKYGASDQRFHHLGIMPLLFWRLIAESKSQGMTRLDFGRSDLSQESLSTFKDRFGARSRTLTYYRYPAPGERRESGLTKRVVGQMCRVLPEPALSLAGKIMYRHIG